MQRPRDQHFAFGCFCSILDGGTDRIYCMMHPIYNAVLFHGPRLPFFFWQVDQSDKDMNDSMTEALVDDKPCFVQFFLDNGLELEKFITLARLLSLYEQVSKQK